MPQWNKNDEASNAVSWVASSLGLGSGKTARVANNTALFGNTTADAFITGQTVGAFGVDTAETQALLGIVPHTGWNLRREGSGGRAGRVTYETLVASGTITSDASDDVTIPDYLITFLTQPAAASANSTANETATFSATTTTTPAGGSVTYKWQANTGVGFADINNGSVYTNTTVTTVTVANTTGLTGAQFRVRAMVTGGTNAFSSAATLTVTT